MINRDVNKLIMNFFEVEGFKEAAKQFQNETQTPRNLFRQF